MRKILLSTFLLLTFLMTSLTAHADSKKSKVKWASSFSSAMKESKKTGKPIFIDFYATWCGPCRMLDEQTYPDAKVVAESRKWVMLKVDVDKNPGMAQRYGIQSLPTLAFMNLDGKITGQAIGFRDAKQFVQSLRYSFGKAAKGQST